MNSASHPSNRCSIFDAGGARLHVEDDLSYIYTPGELTLFPFVQNGIERVRNDFEGAIAARAPGANALLASFDRACSIYAAIETLGAATDIQEIRKYAVLPENTDATIESLKTEIDALKSSNIQSGLKRARDRASVVQSLVTAFEIAQAFDVAKYDTLVEAYRDATRRRDAAGSKAFAGLQMPGVLSAEWRNFIQAGEEYLKQHMTEGYPHHTDSCVYCQQPLRLWRSS